MGHDLRLVPPTDLRRSHPENGPGRGEQHTTSILALNWRDIKNPLAGGAELYTQEVLSRLARHFHYNVTLFTSTFDGAEAEEDLGGVHIVRSGGRFSVYGKAREFYGRHGKNFDLVLDEINTRPFMSPKFVDSGTPIIAVIHQLAREYWWHTVRFPLSALGYYYLEEHWLKGYTMLPTVTVSNSSLAELRSLGFSRVSVIHNGVSAPLLADVPPKSNSFTAVFLARMNRVKRPEDAIRAFLGAHLPNDSRLVLMGDGELLSKLARKYSRFPMISFLGRVGEEVKLRNLREAHVHLAPYLKEGWGATVMEAASSGTPTVGYSTTGLVDSVMNGDTGYLVERFDIDAMSERLEYSWRHPDELKAMASKCLDWSKRFSWDDSAAQFHRLITKVRGHDSSADSPAD